MRRLLLLSALLYFVNQSFSQPLPPCYHSLQEIYDFVFELEDSSDYPERIMIDTIGYSQEDQLPILSVKISDNAGTDYDRPVVVIFGPVHAEEVTGTEVILAAMDILLNDQRQMFRNIRNEIEAYFIPTCNPEGLTVVWGEGLDCEEQGPDVSYRKNKRIHEDDGIFRYYVGWGCDSSGVDLDRNFDINWAHGDSIYSSRDEIEPYNYCRGSAPFSESETQALRDFCYEVQPLLSTTYHDSRTGWWERKVIYLWSWGINDPRESPDYDVIEDISTRYAQQFEPDFEPGGFGTRKGRMHDWMYAAGGWINMETVLEYNQPDPANLARMIEDALPGIWYLMNRAYADQNNITGACGHLKTKVINPQGNPLVAEVLLPEHHDGYLLPRKTDPVWGVNRRPLLPGQHIVITRAFGYESDTTEVVIGESTITRHNVTLQPVASHTVNISIRDEMNEVIPGFITVEWDWHRDTIETGDGWLIESWPVGDYIVEAWADGYVPYRWSWNHTETVIFNPKLVEIDGITQWLDDFELEEIQDGWSSEGDFDWGRSGVTNSFYNGIAALESAPGGFYGNDKTSALTLDIDMTQLTEGSETVTLMGWRQYEIEPNGLEGLVGDSCIIEKSIDGGDWIQLEIISGFKHWHQFFYDLREHRDASNVQIRWTLNTGLAKGDRGMFLDDVSLQASTFWEDKATESVELPGRWALHSAYPNPFNPVTSINFEVAVRSQVSLTVYDVLGREMLKVIDNEMQVGKHRVAIDMSEFSSGLYFVQMKAPGFSKIQKIALLK